MAWASITYTFSPSTIIKSSEINQNFLDSIANANKGMPSGGIILWSGEIANIPIGWYLCDGNNGAPNLIGKFIQGAGSGYAVGLTGGSASSAHTHAYDHYHYDDHVHQGNSNEVSGETHTVDDSGSNDRDVAGNNHYHWFQTWGATRGGYCSTLNATYGYAVQTSGASVTENRPPFYTLAYIMKS
jgi:hypothetical protein